MTQQSEYFRLRGREFGRSAILQGYNWAEIDSVMYIFMFEIMEDWEKMK